MQFRKVVLKKEKKIRTHIKARIKSEMLWQWVKQQKDKSEKMISLLERICF